MALKSWLRNALVVLLAVAWFVFLAPTSIGGSTSYVRVDGHSMDGTYATDDLILQRRHQTYSVGDVITFRVDGGRVIHRIVGGDGVEGYVTQGDNKPDVDPWHPTDADVLGTSFLRIPGGTRPLAQLGNPLVAAVFGALAAAFMLSDSSSGNRHRRRRASTA